MKQKNIRGKILLSLLLIISLTSMVVAQPEKTGLTVPNQFYGDVSVNGQSAPSNLIIEARINGVNVGSTVTINGRYGYDSMFYVEYEGSDETPITFFVEGVQAGTASFISGHSTRVDLSANGVSLPSSGITSGATGGGAAGAGASGGSGGGIAPVSAADTSGTLNLDVTNVSEDNCVSYWVCSEWTECSNNQQRRICVDRNECSESIRPEERRACTMTIEELFGAAPGEKPKNNFLRSITGFFVGADNSEVSFSWLPLIILSLVIAGLFLFLFFFRNRKKQKNLRKK